MQIKLSEEEIFKIKNEDNVEVLINEIKEDVIKYVNKIRDYK